MRMRFIYKYSNIIKSIDCSGDNIVACKNVKKSFEVYNAEDLKYCSRTIGGSQLHDVFGVVTGELEYEGVATTYDGYMMRFAMLGEGMRNTHYTDSCFEGTNLFGCDALRKKSNHILNKQYSKEEYETLVPKIIEHMNSMPYHGKNGRVYKYGEFFPIELSAFAYNETLAQEFFTLTKKQALEKGYNWRDDDAKDFGITRQPDDLPDNIRDVDDSILKEIVGCKHKGECNEKCTTAFRITPAELQFYKRLGIPLPHLCPNCRHYQRLENRNPLKVWDGSCQCAGEQSDNGIYHNTSKSHQAHPSDQHCPNKFETPYGPDSENIVYCETCYQDEVM